MSTRFRSFTLAAVLGLAAAALCSAAPPEETAADAELDVLLGAIRANRKAVVAVNLDLTGEEAGAFWPLYERYQQEMNTLGDRLAAVIRDYTANFRDLADDKARKLMEDYLAIEGDRIKARRTYLDEFSKILPGRKLARFYQIENKMDAVMRYDLAAAIPVVEEGAPPR
jgi:hypothetical protein